MAGMLIYRAPTNLWHMLVILCIATFVVASVLRYRQGSTARSRALVPDADVHTHEFSSGGLETVDAVLRSAERFRRMSDRLEELGVLLSRDDSGWHQEECDARRRLRPVTLPSTFGNLTLYVFDSASDDASVTSRALKGEIFEKEEIRRFLQISNPLPLVDVGANVGLVTLQAAMQGRPVFAVEPVPENAVRLCRSVLDFGHAHLVHVVRNAASSQEGVVTLETGSGNESTLYAVRGGAQAGAHLVKAFAMKLDRLLEILPYPRVALKIDVESHEGHVLEGAERLFQQVDVPVVWMEWEHVKHLSEHGASSVLNFMSSHRLLPYNLMSLSPLQAAGHIQWPFTVLWLREGVRVIKKGPLTEISWS